MKFESILGHDALKQKLTETITHSRVSHSQLFFGPEGNGALALAIAYAQMVLCDNSSEKDSCGVCSTCKQVQNFSYPDLHFAFPISKTKSSPKSPKSIDFINEWKDILTSEVYFGLYHWLEKLGVSNTQASIRVDESSEIQRVLSLKSYSGREKILILWLPERLNVQAANKLLKLIEEPPSGTIFLLVSENSEAILNTILSRCQKVFVPKYSNTEVSTYLENHHQTPKNTASVLAKLADGNVAKAASLVDRADTYHLYATQFVSWVRHCYSANVKDLIEWSEECGGYEKEKLYDFLHFCGNTFSNAFQIKYGNDEAEDAIFAEVSFELKKFSKVLNLKNVPRIVKDIDQAIFEIGRNVSPKIVLSDLSLNMARHLRLSG